MRSSAPQRTADVEEGAYYTVPHRTYAFVLTAPNALKLLVVHPNAGSQAVVAR